MVFRIYFVFILTLKELNNLGETNLHVALINCCGSGKWVGKMLVGFPFASSVDLYFWASKCWEGCTKLDFLEAFTHHPKIGEIDSIKKKFNSTATWASGEQASINMASESVLEELAEGNHLYEAQFGFIFIVCATGKTAAEMLYLLKQRLPNKLEAEIKIAAAEQHKITLLRLEKLLS